MNDAISQFIFQFLEGVGKGGKNLVSTTTAKLKEKLEIVTNNNAHPENAGVGLFHPQKVLPSLRIAIEDRVTIGVNRQIERLGYVGDVGVDIDVGLVIIHGKDERIWMMKDERR